MGKGGCCDKNGLKKGAWSEDEDNKLRAYIQRYGHWNWALLPKFAGVSRSGKSCRLRWMNYLRPNMKHGNFTEEEDDLIIDLHNKLGNRWSTIAGKLSGRSDNEIKNRWNTQLKKRVQEEVSDQANPNVKETYQQEDEIPSEYSPSSSSSTELLSCCNDRAVSSHELAPPTFDDEMVGNFWTDPFLPDNDSMIIPSGDNLWSPYNFVNDDFIPQYSCEDVMMTDEFLWSTYVKDNM